MTDSRITPKFELLVEGSPVDPVLSEAVSVIRVHQHLEMADALELRISNDDLSWTETDALAEGMKIKLKLGYEETELEQVFAGEVVRRDCEFPVRGAAVVTVVAYDLEHKLKRGRVSRTFVDMKDSEIVSEIAQEVGLTADVQDSEVAHRYVFQNAQTNLSFIRERALLLDYEVDIDRENAKVTFRKALAGASVATLKWGANLLSFSPRTTTDEQVSKVIVRGWDMHQKVGIEGSADKTKIRYTLDGADKGAALAEALYGAREVLYTDRPIFEAGEADALAEARLNRHALRYCEGEASCQGDPAILAGSVVTVDGCGERVGGQYYVAKLLHHFEPGVGYSTHFSFVRSTERKTPGEREELPPTLSEREDDESSSPGWMEVRVRSETGESLEGVSYVVRLPNGDEQRGTLDETQTIHVEGIRDPGEAQIELNPPEDLDALE